MPEITQPIQPATQRATILLVDDQPENLHVLRRMLEDPGLEVAEARSCEEAARAILEHDYAVILLDIQKHSQDGFEMVRRLRAKDANWRTPILFLTTHDTDSTVFEQACALQAVDFLTKPFSPDALKAKVALLVEFSQKTKRLQSQSTSNLERRESEKPEQRRIEQALEAADRRYKVIVEQSITGMYVIQGDRFAYVNRKMEEIFDASAAELTSRPILEWIAPEDRDLARENIRKRLHGGVQSIHYSLRMLRRDGRMIHAEVHGSRSEFNGNPAILGVLLDVSESRRAANALRESEAQFHTMADAIPQLAWMAQPDGFVFWFNRRWFEYTGITLAQSQGWGWQCVHDPKLLPVVLVRWKASIATGEPFEMEFPLRGADGRFRWFLSRVFPLLDAAGSVVRWFGTSTDIGQKREAEQAVVRYSQRLRILHEIDGAVIAGEKPASIAATALPALRELLGVGRVVVNLFDLQAGEVEWLAAAGRRRVRVGPGVRYSIRFMGDVEALKCGEAQLVHSQDLPPGPDRDALLESGVHEYAVAPMIAKGELIGALSFGGSSEPFSREQMEIAQEVATQFAIALTQARLQARIQRQAEELEVRVQERTQELEAAHAKLQATNAEMVKLTDELRVSNKELEAFSYSVSHDLRAPLRGIDGFSRILMEQYASCLPEPAMDHLRDVRGCAQEMGRLVDDLLEFSRLGRQPINQKRVATDQLVSQCWNAALSDHEGRQVQFVRGDLAPCRGDASLLKQVWMNLLSNALKYTRKRDAAVIEVGCQFDSPGAVTYFVRDNGVGFDMRYAHKLFRVFQRLHRAEEYEGTGVGLAIVQRIVHRHGGRVWAEGKPREGATFYLTLSPGDSDE